MAAAATKEKTATPPVPGTAITVKLAKIKKEAGEDPVLVAQRDVAGVITGAPITRARYGDERKAKITHEHDGLVPAAWYDGRGGWRSTFVWMGDDYAGADPYMVDESDATKGCIAGAFPVKSS